ncbi:hypothetical protein L2E82_06526 [Cichorium intybus]|uniref:Uncharacterized protein n=1 Tax=Cichorium intybus TaxID=13427 RepID=A0ACB9H9T4_CICIN|nr:hypothetical protein L2E82_06526 [Cichorium intybus]
MTLCRAFPGQSCCLLVEQEFNTRRLLTVEPHALHTTKERKEIWRSINQFSGLSNGVFITSWRERERERERVLELKQHNQFCCSGFVICSFVTEDWRFRVSIELVKLL